MKNTMLILMFCLLTACGSDGTDELYARERALPAYCRVAVTEQQARAMVADLLPTIPVRVEILSASSHQTRRDKVTGMYTVALSSQALTSQAVAHEAAHVVLFDAYRPSGPFEQPPPQPPLHGDIFIGQYKRFLKQVVGGDCAAQL